MNILIVRLSALGDIVHALPAAAALRRAFPAARIDWLVDARYRAVLDLVPSIDRRLVIGRRRSRDGGVPAGHDVTFGGWSGLGEAIRGLRRGRYDVALDFQGLLKSALLARSSGARRVIGFPARLLRERAARLFYTEAGPAPDGPHVLDKNLALIASVGVEDRSRRFPIEIPSSELPARITERLGGVARFALLSPGAGWPNKRWPPDRFAAVAAWLDRCHALRSVVVWGPGEEALAGDVVDRASGAAVLAPPTTVADLVALCQAAALLVAGDTGPIHLAAAVDTPVVGLYGPTDPARNGPWAADDVTLSRFAECVCHHKRRCRRPNACLADITVEEVMAAIDRRLERARRDG
jgi:lipopolysaccharide heptosyltransferase I